MKTFNRITAGILLCVLLLMAAPTVYAADHFEFTVHYTYNDGGVPGARYHIYKVGEVTPEGKFQLTGKFADYPVAVDGLTGSELQSAADTLYGYAQRDEIHANQTVITNAYGYAYVHSLSRGLYLVAGKPVYLGGSLYVSQPLLLPVTEDIVMEVKCEVREVPTEPQTLSVLKKWVDEGYESKRPDSISVSLLQDGYVLETVTLNAENNWRHTWTDLEPGWEWTVAEDCPDQFAVTLQREGDTFILTNTRTVFPQDPPPPTVPQTGTHAPAIPQTGLVWWPVLALLAAGILLIVAGVKLCRKERKDA